MSKKTKNRNYDQLMADLGTTKSKNKSSKPKDKVKKGDKKKSKKSSKSHDNQKVKTDDKKKSKGIEVRKSKKRQSLKIVHNEGDRATEYDVYRVIRKNYSFKIYQNQVFVLNEVTGVHELYEPNQLAKLVEEVVIEDDFAKISLPNKTTKLYQQLLTRTENEVKSIPRYSSKLLCKSGVLDIKTMEIVDRETDDMFLSAVQFNYIDDVNDEMLTKWNSFLYDVAKDDESLKDLIQVMVGNLVLGCMLFSALYFVGRVPMSGKSTLMSLIESACEGQVGSLEFSRLSKPFDVSTLEFSRYNACMDVSPNISQSAMSILKRLGTDSITIEGKNKPSRPIRLPIPVVFSTNTKIKIPKSDPGFSRRIVCVPFNYTAPIPREELLEELKGEIDAILSICLKKLSESLNAGALPTCEASQEAKELWFEVAGTSGKTENVDKFVRKKLVLTQDVNDVIFCSDIYKKYLKYEKGKDRDVLAYNVFCRELKSKYKLKDAKRKNPKTNQNSHCCLGVKFAKRKKGKSKDKKKKI